MNIVEKLAIAPVPKLASPCEFGPTIRMPPARARATIGAPCALPLPASLSPKPELMTMASFTPAAAQSSTASTAVSPGTATIATSGRFRAASEAGQQAGQP